jgi:2-polyprenyl-3-methyl-5-hydroxy-6-metoxy-1,4-benzoquinol methylase
MKSAKGLEYEDLIDKIISCAIEIHKKLGPGGNGYVGNKHISGSTLVMDISEMSRDYLKSNIKNNADEFFSNLINLAVGDYQNKKIGIIDYGGGTGLLSMQAKLMGAELVIYCDLSAQMCRDAQIIALKNGLQADHYICGEIDRLINYINEHDLYVNALCSHDVIEHIVDLDYFVKRLPDIKHQDNFKIVLSSSANIYNPLIFLRTMKSHYKAEKLYRTRRKQLKLENKKYYHSSLLNPRDPISGYWPDRLMTFSYLRDLFKRNGLNVKIKKGYYTESNWRRFMNPFIRVSGFLCAPYYICVANIPADQNSMTASCNRDERRAGD